MPAATPSLPAQPLTDAEITELDDLLAAVPERGDPRDALVGATLQSLRDGAVVTTGQSIAAFDVALLTYDHDGSETTGDSFTIRVTDDGGGAGVASRLTRPTRPSGCRSCPTTTIRRCR